MRDEVYGTRSLDNLLARVEKEVIARDARITRLVCRPSGEGRLYLELYLRPAECPEFCLPLVLTHRGMAAGDISTMVSSILWAAEHATRVQVVTPLEQTRSFRITA
ncbi:hypothetical protein [Desulfotomaculum copahuensis]|uniref:hypothetical protein n=1 Tax=Desulfotomaculum copahuensis TaxID=1838280 RepID=UPI001248057C|nr:hypothetical protein [Desulfotomaculum copahuensis]